MAARPVLPVLAALLLSAAPEPVPRVSLPYGECPLTFDGGGSAGTGKGNRPPPEAPAGVSPGAAERPAPPGL